MSRHDRTTILVEAALSVALAAVLGQLKLWEMPQGGSVSLGMLPLLVFALRRGAPWGLAAGAVYGMLSLLLEPYVVHPVQLVLDYPAPYALLGLAGLASPAYRRAASAGRAAVAMGVASAGIALGATGRYVSHVVSGVVFFGEYAPEGQNVWIYSAVYNTYVPLAALACAAAAVALLPALQRVRPVGTVR